MTVKVIRNIGRSIRSIVTEAGRMACLEDAAAYLRNKLPGWQVEEFPHRKDVVILCLRGVRFALVAAQEHPEKKAGFRAGDNRPWMYETTTGDVVPSAYMDWCSRQVAGGWSSMVGSGDGCFRRGRICA